MSDTHAKFAKLSALQTTEVVLALRQHFDTEKGTFHEGWSDQRIADLVKCKVSGVEHIRVQNFARLRASPSHIGFANVRASLDTHRMEIDALTEDYAKLRADFVQLVTIVRYGASSSALKSALVEIEKRYAQVGATVRGDTNSAHDKDEHQ
jgi:hypothetical protein